MLIGIDDTDSPDGMCTTYLGAVLAEKLENAGSTVKSAHLIRLNPNVKFKTRGNAAICLEVIGGSPDEIFSIAKTTIDSLAETEHPRTEPGLVLTESLIPVAFYQKAVTSFCTIEEARSLLEATGAKFYGWKGGRGLIGATAAVSAVSSHPDDQTSEFLAYRNHRDKGLRKVEAASLWDADRVTKPHTWDSVDPENNCIVCVPHTPDPVLYGIRGDSEEWVRKAAQIIRSQSPERTMCYQTNQGTDAHLINGEIGNLTEGHSYRLSGVVASAPKTGRGGHVSFLLSGGKDSDEVQCMAYEPTKGFRDVVRSLLPGDSITICGSLKEGSINLEKMQVHTAPAHRRAEAPICNLCGKRMTSAGKNKGYKCRKCGERATSPDYSTLKRTLVPGWYEVPPCARRHLARPLIRDLP